MPEYNQVVEDIKELMGYYKKKEEEIISQIKTIIEADEKLLQDYKNITSIKGIFQTTLRDSTSLHGEISGISLLHLFIKYPEANQRQITSLAGIDPIDRNLGTSIQSKSRISKAGSKLYTFTL